MAGSSSDVGFLAAMDLASNILHGDIDDDVLHPQEEEGGADCPDYSTHSAKQPGGSGGPPPSPSPLGYVPPRPHQEKCR